MRFRDDERGVTVQVGAVLLLGIIVVALSIYQVQVVPAQNEQVEFDHSQAVQSDLQQVRNAILGTATGDSSDPAAVELGTRYPARTLFVNPPPVSGTLQTADASSPVEVDNARAVNPETDDYWTGTSRSFETDRLAYTPDYAVYDTAPTTVYENSVVYNEFAGAATVTLSDERLIDDRTISLVALDGRLSRSQTGTVTVDPEGVSASTRTVAVEDDGDPVRVTVPTQLSQSAWEDLLADERVANGGHVDSLSVSGETLTVTLEPGVYRLRLAKVGVGTNVAGTSAAYLTTVDAPETTTPGTTQQFTVEVRDGFDNPVSGETVTATADRGTVAVVGSSLSDEDGRVTFSYTAPSAVGDGDVQLDVSYDDPTRSGFAGEDPEDIAYTVDVASAGGGGGSSTARTVISTSFENEGTSLGEYGWSGNGAGESVGDFRGGSGTQAAYLGGDDAPNIIESPEVDTSGGGYLDVEFVASDDGAEAGVNEDLIVEYYDADGTWQEVTTVEAQAPDDVNFSRRHIVADAAAFHDQFRLRFRQPETTGTDRWYVDDVRVFVVGSGGGGGGGSNSAPSASFDFSPSTPTTSDRIDFDASGSGDDGSITSYEWDWTSDGTFDATDRTAQHSYADSGTYTVTLRVTDDDGATTTATRQVDVSAPSGTVVGYVAGSGEARVNGQRSGVRFVVENTGDQPAEIVGIEVSVAGGPARSINERNGGRNAPDQHEVYIQSSDNGFLEMSGGQYFDENDRALQLDTRENLNDTAVVQPGDEATVNTFQYRNNGGRVIDNMGGRELTVTLYFADGTSRQYTFTATDPY